MENIKKEFVKTIIMYLPFSIIAGVTAMFLLYLVIPHYLYK